MAYRANEVELAAQDAAHGGTAFMQDGKRIDPTEVYALPAETVSEAVVEAALTSWYPGEWPDAEVFKSNRLFADNCRASMRKVLESCRLIESMLKDGGR